MLIEFVIQNQFFSYTLEEFAQILDIPFEGACVFIDKWSLDELAYGVPRDGPYQNNPPPHDDIILYIRNDQEGGNQDHVPACLCNMLYCIVRSEKFNLTYYMVKQMEWVTKQARLILPYDRVMNPLTAQQERKTRKDYGTRRGRHSTSSSSSAFDQPSSSHLNDDDDENDKGTSRTSTPSTTRFVNSFTN
ncbi:hypothetical protein Tco_0283074 [Tanacetum coccineum]